MNDLSRFKQIADEIHKDMVVHEVLKERVRARCLNERKRLPYKALIPAACLVLILAVSGLFGNAPERGMPSRDNTENIMMLTAGSDAAKAAGWELSGLDEAKAVFDGKLRVPSHMPEGYALTSIQAVGDQKKDASGMILSYANGDQLITVLQEKQESVQVEPGFRTMSTGGREFHVQATPLGSETQIELHWFSGGIHYAVTGLIIEEEAVAIALSMK